MVQAMFCRSGGCVVKDRVLTRGDLASWLIGQPCKMERVVTIVVGTSTNGQTSRKVRLIYAEQNRKQHKY